MSLRDALIVILPTGAQDAPQWMRVVDGGIVQDGTGTDWLNACGLRALPDGAAVMLVVPVTSTTVHSIALPDLPVRQGRAAARIAAIDASIGQPDSLMAATIAPDESSTDHLVAVTARADVQHWLLWAQHHGLDPDILMPAAFVLPQPVTGFVRGQPGSGTVLRGVDSVLDADDPLAPLLIGDAPMRDMSQEAVRNALLEALERPAVNMRTGDFAKRTPMMVDRQQIARIAMWCGCIALASLLIALITIMKLNSDASTLDSASVQIARAVLPQASDAAEAEREIDAQLAMRGTGAYGFTGPVSGLFTAMRSAPSVSLTLLDRSQDGMVKATLASAKADDINVVLLALQASGFTITATSSQDNSGRVLADITVRP